LIQIRKLERKKWGNIRREREEKNKRDMRKEKREFTISE
jgi:hypothetical protein